ncbi:MAG TPA: HD domain-containing protein [Aestuariivirga sp.]|nr:HD domain-containing protein [Aestuariivirga sp.]
MSTIERAIEIAARAHAGQFDPAGEPYILHPLRMMLTLHSPESRIAAILHDVVEKADDWTLERLRLEGFSADVLEAVEALTKTPGETFEDLVKRAGRNKIGRLVKVADIEDHLQHFPMGKNSSKYPQALMMLQSGAGL